MIYLRLLVITFSSLHELVSVYMNTNDVYVSNGDSIVLECKVLPNVKSAWEIIIPNDNANITTFDELRVLTDGNEINPYISNINKLAIVGNISEGDYNLEIQNVSSTEEGKYRCSQRINENKIREHQVFLKIKVKPKNVKILRSKDEVIKGEEGNLLNLTCSVESGIPPETITWFNSSSPVKSGGPSVLTISIIPTRHHHHEQFSCKVEADSLLTPIQMNITLDIKYNPSVTFNTSNHIIVTENSKMTLLCNSDGNPLVKEMQIENERNQVLTHCRQSICKLTILKIQRAAAGLYKCSAINAIGTADTVVHVNVTYPPSVAVEHDKGRAELQCNPDGNPPRYTFHLWEHQSKFRETIRTLNGSKYLKLLSSLKNYQLNGIYICKVDNGIADIDGSIVQSGETSVQLSDKPIFVSQNMKTQYGRFGHNVDITIYVFSFPEITNVHVVKDGEYLGNKTKFLDCIENSTLTDTIYNTQVHILGSILTLQRYHLTKDDFTVYEFNVANKIGHATFRIELDASDKPEKPNINEVFPYIDNIIVSWTSTFNGGKEQQFILEYKNAEASEWNAVPAINDSSANCCHHVIENLVADTEYMIRIQAMNELGESKFTKIRIVKTLPSKTDQSGIATTITRLVLVVIVVVTVLSMVSLVYLKRGYFHKKKCSRQSSIPENELQDDMAVENYIYQSQGNMLENRNQQVQHDNQSSTNRQNTPLLEGRNTSRHQNPLTANSSDNEDKRDSIQERTFKIAREQDNAELNYLEIVFEPLNPTNEAEIHGINDRTIYADIDTGAVGVPLEESAESDDDDDDDFMYIEGIIDYTQKS